MIYLLNMVRINLLKNVCFIFAFFCITLLAVNLRLFNIMSKTQWFADSARDITIAKKISSMQSFSPIAPYAALSDNHIKNTYVWFNLLAIFWSIGQSPESVVICFTTIGILALFASFEIGRQIGGKWLGLTCLFSLAINSSLAKQQISVFQRNIIPSILLLLMMVSLHTFRKKSLVYLIIAIYIYFLGVLLHYSMATITPVVMMLTIVTLIQNKCNCLIKGITIVGTLVSLIVIWLILSQNNLNMLGSYIQSIFQVSNSNLNFGWNQVIRNVLNLFQITFSDNLSTSANFLIHDAYDWQTQLISGIWIVLALGGLWVSYKYKIHNSLIIFLFFFSYILILLTFPLITNERIISTLNAYYMIHYGVVIVLLIPISIYLISYYYGKKYTNISLFLVCIIMTALNHKYIYNNFFTDGQYFPNEYSHSMIISKKIVQDMEQEKNRSIAFVEYSNWGVTEWWKPAFIYFIEEMSGKSYTTLSPNFVSQSIFSYPANTIYLLCTNLSDTENTHTIKDMDNLCLQPFISNHLDHYVDRTKDEIKTMTLTSFQEGLGIGVYKISSNLIQ